MPVRIYDIAKKLGLESKEVISKAKALNYRGVFGGAVGRQTGRRDGSARSGRAASASDDYGSAATASAAGPRG
jgi:hypothetical protein